MLGVGRASIRAIQMGQILLLSLLGLLLGLIALILFRGPAAVKASLGLAALNYLLGACWAPGSAPTSSPTKSPWPFCR